MFFSIRSSKDWGCSQDMIYVTQSTMKITWIGLMYRNHFTRMSVDGSRIEDGVSAGGIYVHELPCYPSLVVIGYRTWLIFITLLQRLSFWQLLFASAQCLCIDYCTDVIGIWAICQEATGFVFYWNIVSPVAAELCSGKSDVWKDKVCFATITEVQLILQTGSFMKHGCT